jgi:hypothetical protein
MSTLIVTKSDHTTDVTFTQDSESGYKQGFADLTSGLTAPVRIDFEHRMRPVGAKGTDRHIITISKGDVDSTTGAFSLATVQLVISVPRAAAFTATVMKDLAKYMQCLLKQSIVGDFVNGVSPSGDYHQDSFVPD